MKTQRKIIHVDMDCFYAAIEMRDHPELRNIPIAIGGPAQSRSVLCTANYEARKFGVKAAMPSYKAIQQCPHLKIIPPNFSKYKEASQAIHQIFKKYTSKIEPLSLDEAYLDVSDVTIHGDDAFLIALNIRKEIKEATGLDASAGIAPNKFLAKIASDWNKPNGQFQIKQEEIQNFVKDLDVRKIPGVGRVTAEKLYGLGLKTCSDIEKKEQYYLNHHFGKMGQSLFQKSRGIDLSEVNPRDNRKSVSVENTLNQNIKSNDLFDFVWGLQEEVSSRLLRYLEKKPSVLVHKIFVKIKTHEFDTHSIETTLSDIRSLLTQPRQFELVVKDLVDKLLKRHDFKEIRLVGLGFRLKDSQVRNDLNSSHQLSLLL